MLLRLLFFLALLTTTVSPYAQGQREPESIESARTPVQAFQRMPPQEVFCSVENWETGENGVPEILMPKFDKLFGKEMLRLFVWANCRKPKFPHMLETERSFFWDFRYGTPGKSSEGDIVNIRVLPAKQIKDGRARVTVLYDWGTKKNLMTLYTLIREDGQWKIDDIALKGYSTEMEEYLPSSKSLKTELQAAYKRAEEKYLKDQQSGAARQK